MSLVLRWRSKRDLPAERLFLSAPGLVLFGLVPPSEVEPDLARLGLQGREREPLVVLALGLEVGVELAVLVEVELRELDRIDLVELFLAEELLQLVPHLGPTVAVLVHRLASEGAPYGCPDLLTTDEEGVAPPVPADELGFLVAHDPFLPHASENGVDDLHRRESPSTILARPASCPESRVVPGVQEGVLDLIVFDVRQPRLVAVELIHFGFFLSFLNRSESAMFPSYAQNGARVGRSRAM